MRHFFAFCKEVTHKDPIELYSLRKCSQASSLRLAAPLEQGGEKGTILEDGREAEP
jgi:hypothetical protein